MDLHYRFGPWFVEPVIAGLTEDNKPFLSSMDCLGCEMMTKDFVVAGTMEDALYGMCESLYRPDLVSGYSRIIGLLCASADHSLCCHRSRRTSSRRCRSACCRPATVTRSLAGAVWCTFLPPRASSPSSYSRARIKMPFVLPTYRHSPKTLVDL